MTGYQRLQAPYALANNPWTRGLRFFTLFDNSNTNYAQPGVGQYHNLTSNSPFAPTAGTAGYPGLTFDGTNHDYITWTQWDGKITGAVTVIARWKPSAGAIGSALGTWQNNEGFSLLFVSGTFGAEDGVEMIVGHTGTNLLISSGSHASFEGIEATVAGRYDSVSRTVDIWQNGVQLATNTDVGKDWNSTATTDLASGIILGTSQFFDGALYWVACFDRALTDDEIRVWTTADPADLISPPEPLIFHTETYETGTVVLVDQEFMGDSPYILGTVLSAEAATAGDIPSSGGTGSLDVANELTVIQQLLTTLTIPILTQNVLAVNQSISLTSLNNTANEVGVANSVNLYLLDEPNVLVGNRYRR